MAQEYQDLPDLGQITFHTLQQQQSQQQLRTYLTSCSIKQSTIQNIGGSRKATLAAYGIKTAWDVTSASIQKIPGFGEKLEKDLLTWREHIEQQFVFQPTWTLGR